jgi:hypothetical protein
MVSKKCKGEGRYSDSSVNTKVQENKPLYSQIHNSPRAELNLMRKLKEQYYNNAIGQNRMHRKQDITLINNPSFRIISLDPSIQVIYRIHNIARQIDKNVVAVHSQGSKSFVQISTIFVLLLKGFVGKRRSTI